MICRTCRSSFGAGGFGASRLTRRFACTCACTCTCICACACIHACARACACVCVCVWHAYCICTCISHVHDICIAYVQLCPCPCGALAAASYFDRLRLSVVTFASDFRTFICSSTRAVSTIECEARIRASRRSPIDPSSALAANVRFARRGRVGHSASSNFFPCRTTPHRARSNSQWRSLSS